jgi:hypothetical protein
MTPQKVCNDTIKDLIIGEGDKSSILSSKE